MVLEKRTVGDRRWPFPLPFDGEVSFVGIVAGLSSATWPGTWSKRKGIYRKVAEEGTTVILPTHQVQGSGYVCEFAVLESERERRLLYWVRIAAI